MSEFQDKVKQSLDFDVYPGIDMLVTREEVEEDDLMHYILVKFFTEGEDTLKLFNAESLLEMFDMAQEATSYLERLRAFDKLVGYLSWLVLPLKGEIETMVVPSVEDA